MPITRSYARNKEILRSLFFALLLIALGVCRAQGHQVSGYFLTLQGPPGWVPIPPTHANQQYYVVEGYKQPTTSTVFAQNITLGRTTFEGTEFRYISGMRKAFASTRSPMLHVKIRTARCGKHPFPIINYLQVMPNGEVAIEQSIFDLGNATYVATYTRLASQALVPSAARSVEHFCRNAPGNTPVA